ncbi:MAG: hypothetical protein Q7K47_01150 [Fusobacterium sp. JB019]|nr:hypothetical protein [Fusobacterium sp. JB019]
MAKLEVTLKQHTPLIHFESDIEGATLRATELKSKLDKFLIEHFQKESIDYSNYLIKGQKKSFNYKVKIKNVKNYDKEDIEKNKIKNGKIEYKRSGQPKKINFPLFFANLGEENKDKFFSYCDNLEVEFFSFKKEVIEKIRDLLPEFLFLNNFGTRQSKGFGSFFINDELIYKLNQENKKYEENVMKKLKESYPYFEVKTDKEGIEVYKNYKKLFYKIELFYKSLRSGINQVKNGESVFYFKSLIFLYAKDKNIQWDKKSIKEAYFSKNLKKEQTKHKGNKELEKYLIKDLLGLSKEESWMTYNGNITKENNCSDKKKSIDRFQSPIFFKPIRAKNENKFQVFFKGNNNSQILDKEFIIKNNGVGNLKLSTPKKFDINDFFKCIFEKNIFDEGEDKYVEKKFQNRSEFKELREIYEKIRNKKYKRLGDK